MKIFENQTFDDFEDSHFPVTESSFLFSYTTNENVMKSIKQLKCSSKPDSFGMTSNFKKKIASTTVLTYLAICFNSMIDHGTYPTILKIGKVYPIFKKGKKDLAENYRPISTLSNINKIFEYLIQNEIRSYFERYNLLSSNQHGFVLERNTTTAIFSLLNEIYQSFNTNSVLLALFIDFSKAFDLVDIDLFLYKLKKYGFLEKSLALIESYLKRRSFQVFFNGQMSKSQDLLYGVPQGSILGPLFFIIYLNDLFFLPISNKFISFADDTVTLKSIKNDLEINEFVSDCNILFKFLHSNRLVINFDKCFLVKFHLGNSSISRQLGDHLLFEQSSINFIHEVTYLGIIIDSKLCFNSQMARTKKNMLFYLKIFFFLKNLISPDILTVIYRSFILPKIEYANIAYFPNNLTYFKKIEKINKKLVNFTTLSKIKFNLDHRLFLSASTFLHKIHNSQCFFSFFNFQHVNRSNSKILYILPHISKEKCKKNFQYWGAQLSNKLYELSSGTFVLEKKEVCKMNVDNLSFSMFLFIL